MLLENKDYTDVLVYENTISCGITEVHSKIHLNYIITLLSFLICIKNDIKLST